MASEELKAIAEVCTNLTETNHLIGPGILSAVGGLVGSGLGGIISMLKWRKEHKEWRESRSDRATDILLQLEREFNKPSIKKAQRLIEDRDAYAFVRERLRELAGQKPCGRPEDVPQKNVIIDEGIDAIDELLRFYVVLCGIRFENQIRDESLGTCFRFWLAHYYHEDRDEFYCYVRKYYPTLRRWLEEEEKFFRPIEFDFPIRKKNNEQDQQPTG